MHIKYSPCNSNKDTVITVKSLTAPEVLDIDGREIGPFDADGIQWPDIAKETDGALLEAHRDSSGELYLTVTRFYSSSCSEWDTGDYHDMGAEAKAAEAAKITEYLVANGVSSEDAASAAAEVTT